jgi:hypothetical protein
VTFSACWRFKIYGMIITESCSCSFIIHWPLLLFVWFCRAVSTSCLLYIIWKMGECSLLNKLDLSSCVTMYMTFVMLFIYAFFFTCFVSQLHLLIQLPLTVTLMLSRLLPLDDENMGRVISGVYTYSHSLSFGQVHLRPWCSFCRTFVAPFPGLKFSFHIWSVFIFTQETSLDMGYFSKDEDIFGCYTRRILELVTAAAELWFSGFIKVSSH